MKTPAPTWDLQVGDALDLLPQLTPESIDAMLADPPYSSGGMVRADRCHTNSTRKYSRNRSSLQVLGDSRDQLQWMQWTGTWLRAATPALKPGALVGIFIDWRQISACIGALGLAGLVYRGIVPWWKETCRPVPGRPRQECEFVVWGTHGPRARSGPSLPGLLRGKVTRQGRKLFCSKPVPTMRDLVQWAPPGGTVLDPFAGSGSTGVAALQEGRSVVLMELSRENAAACREAMVAAQEGAAAVAGVKRRRAA